MYKDIAYFLFFIGLFQLGHAQESSTFKGSFLKIDSTSVITLKLNSRKEFDHFVLNNKSKIVGSYPRLNIIAYRPENELNSLSPSIRALDIYQDLRLESNLSNPNFHINNIRTAQDSFPLYFELSNYVYLKEFSPLPHDIDLYDKIVETSLSSSLKDVHANDMSTIICGLGNSSLRNRGVAFKNSIFTTGLQSLLPDPDDLISDYPIKIQNHSYGVEIENYYGLEAEAYDDATFYRKQFLPIFSVGNSGEKPTTSGSYINTMGYATLTGNFKQCKNCLTVGAINESYDALAISSKGPAYDGRIKPELVAYAKDGTSSSAALVSGSAAVLQSILEKNGIVPSNPLIRALLIGGANDLGDPGPDFIYGFGNLDLFTSIQLIEKENFIASTLSDTIAVHALTVPKDIASVKITLTWLDKPNSSGSQKALTENLNLIVKNKTDTHFPSYPVTLKSNENLTFSTLTGIDSLNTIEQITIENPLSGGYLIEVFHNSYIDPIDYAITYNFKKKKSFTWLSPTSDYINEEDEIFAKWSSTYDTSPEIQYRYDADQWQEAPPPSSHPQLILMAEQGHAHIQFRAIVDRDTFATKKVRLMSPSRIELANQCEDKRIFTIPNATEQDTHRVIVYTDLGKEVIDTITGDYFMLDGIYSPYTFIAIEKYKNDTIYQNNNAQRIGNLSAECFFRSCSLESDNTKINLDITLNTPYLLKEVKIYTFLHNNWTILNSVSNPSREFQVVDTDPIRGSNYYYIEAVTVDGEVYLSDTYVTLYSALDDILVFPTLVTDRNFNLEVVQNSHIGRYIQVLDLNGKILFDDTIDSIIEIFDLTHLSTGIYYYVIKDEKHKPIQTDGILIK